MSANSGLCGNLPLIVCLRIVFAKLAHFQLNLLNSTQEIQTKTFSSYVYSCAWSSKVMSFRSAGKTDVNLEFSCHFHSNLGYSSTHFYTAAGTLQVIPDPPLALGMCATWLLPPSYRTSSLLRQSTEAGLESMSITKRNIVYSMLQVGWPKFLGR
mgnify:CR=1 FL=1